MSPYRVTPTGDGRVQIAITHWLFADWPDRFFALLDALILRSLHCRQNGPFEKYPRTVIVSHHYPEAFGLIEKAYKQYQSILEHQGHRELNKRVQQRLSAFGNLAHDELRL
jgi:hypothetical protein